VIKNLKAEIAGISSALSNYFENNDFKKLYELSKK
jgi:hypothetical protein